MEQITPDAQFVQQSYADKLAEATHKSIILEAVVKQLSTQVEQLSSQNQALTSELDQKNGVTTPVPADSPQSITG